MEKIAHENLWNDDLTHISVLRVGLEKQRKIKNIWLRTTPPFGNIRCFSFVKWVYLGIF
jgi:hypothetical protein